MWIFIGLFFAGVGLFFYWGYKENQHLVVTRYGIASKNLPKEFDKVKIAFLSDLHNNEFGEKNEKLKETLLKENPDFVIVGGDMIVGKPDMPYDVPLELMIWLKKHFLVLYGMGNHEYRTKIYPNEYGKLYENYNRGLKKNGIEILDNKKVYWERNGAKIAVYGLTIDKYYYKRLKIEQMRAQDIARCIGKKERRFSILLAHNPIYFSAYADWGADLVLSGHNHGGVMRLPFLGGVVSPNYRFFPKYDVGEFKQKDATMILSAGLGSHTLPFRFFNPPELVIIELQSK